MSKPSKVDRMPPEIRELIAELRQSGWTIDQIMEVLRDLSQGKQPRLPGSLPPSLTELPTINPDMLPHRSKLGKHIQGLDQISERLQETRAIAEALVRKTGQQESRLTQLNVELMHSVITQLVMAAQDPEGLKDLLKDPETIMFLSRSIKDLASAKKTDADMIIKLRQEFAKQAVQKVDAITKEAVQSGEKGLSKERIDQLKRELAGLGG